MSDMPFLEISGEIEPSLDIHCLEQVLKVFCDVTKKTKNTEVSLVFCASEEMRKINRIYRGVDKTTDVLSFPAEGLNLAGNSGTVEPAFLGEILIDLNYISEHLEQNTLQDAVTQTFIHGLVHLSGYDHISQTDRKAMQDMENIILKLIQLEGNCE
jgi:probable rRNA maturation factor